jgi:glyoxylase-like metal-dependent hydrolase (beta-lactamase superfamily II)
VAAWLRGHAGVDAAAAKSLSTRGYSEGVTACPQRPPLPEDVSVLERGWLSSNNVLVHDRRGDGGGAVLVDTGHCSHAAQTVALLRDALGEHGGLGRIVNTHLHSDHCGGNAAVAAAFGGVPIDVPPGSFEAVRRWDEAALSYRATGQRCERFTPRAALPPGGRTRLGAREWELIAAPGHDPDALMLFDAEHGVLITGDALWENGFGVVFPELEGQHAFDDVAAVLDVIERLPVAAVIPGHGAPFGDVPAALARARSRLAAYRIDPDRHARHAARVLLKYHLMEERQQPLQAVLRWAQGTSLFVAIWQQVGARLTGSPDEWAARLVDELARSGALHVQAGVVCDA